MPRKSVHIITPHFVPEVTAAAHRMEAAANALSSAYKVNVFALAERGSSVKEHTVKCNEHLSIHYLPVKSYAKSNFFVRAYFEWVYAMKLIRKSNSIHADLAIITIPFMFLLPVAAMFCKAKIKVADIRDIVWDYLSASTPIKRLVKLRLMAWMHRSLTKFNAVAVTNEVEKKWLLLNTTLKEDKLFVIPNGISMEKFSRLSELEYAPHPQKFTITYIGNIGTSQHFYTLINSVKEMRDVRLVLVGSGNEWSNIKNYLSTNSIQNVFLHEKKKWIRTLPFYQSSNLLFASLKEDFDTAIPSKLYEYLSTGLPVLYLGKGAAAAFLKTFSNTFVVGIYEEKYLERVIWNVMRLAPVRSGKNMLTIKKNFIREKLSNRYVEIAARLLNSKEISNVFIEDILLSTEQ